MRTVYSFILTFYYSFCFAQFGVINDSDGFVNVRSTPETTTNITDKLLNNFVVYAFEPKGNWINIDYKKNDKERNGFIYKNRIKYISDFTSVPLKSNQNGKVVLENEDVKVELVETDFIKENHKLTFYKNEGIQLTKIDGIQIFGTDGNLPKREYKSISILLDNNRIILPLTALQNVYEPTLFNSKAYYDKAKKTLYISSSNSDGAGGYEVIWILENNKYKGRMEAYGF